MRLFIAEKHEVGQAIAKTLGNPRRKDGYYTCGNDVVTWCAGHMLELCPPEDYDEALRKWTLESLPIINIPWKYRVIEGRGKQFGVIANLIKQADEIVNAGDTDAEGQLLVDEILEYCKNRKAVKRILINDNNEKLIRRALGNLRENSEFFGLYQSALARMVGDKLYGFNLTRLYTLKGREKGFNGILSVGRVQTPILGLVVARDRAIADHRKTYYFTVKGQFSIQGLNFPALFRAPEDSPLDEKGRIESEVYAQRIASACKGQPAKVISVDKKIKQEAAPLPYDLLELQVDASRKFGVKADKTLKITQELREKKLITYNRSDCRYLNDENHQDAPEVLATIVGNAPLFAPFVKKSDPSRKSRAFNNANVTAHHAIIPTQGRGDISSLTEDQRNIYLLICRAYIAQFWPLKESRVIIVNLEVEGYQFRAVNTQIISPGWSALYKNDKGNQEIESGKSDDSTTVELSQLSKGYEGFCTDCQSEKKETLPPKAYTEATLLKDLKQVAKYIKNSEIAKLLRDKDKGKKGESGGIGTPSTRDSFIVKLKERDFIEEKRKLLVSTKLGREFHDALPATATAPDMTALWHQQQKDIQEGRINLDTFLAGLVKTVTEEVIKVREMGLPIKDNSPNCPICKVTKLRRIKGKNGFFWGCIGYPSCEASFPDKRGKPNLEPKPKANAGDTTDHACPECENGNLIKRRGKSKKTKKFYNWYGCDQYPTCKASFFENDAKLKFG
ncbi:DNA topoisomerase 3 [Microbulbifer sp. OS29]|uniref:DNA topoisomerase n=1 Tax=Microbulbifer okhotskensis TaxID=2926617 RepID=A0A9X2J7I3_9GAMM|nr:DNA topoisomerase 3 [Microbulbifer okhotskensis]MCO1336629.1 DNA topoisomerase 3 [Microbulbifer okhotskensis]